jgi:hypothetical protein
MAMAVRSDGRMAGARAPRCESCGGARGGPGLLCRACSTAYGRYVWDRYVRAGYPYGWRPRGCLRWRRERLGRGLTLLPRFLRQERGIVIAV